MTIVEKFIQEYNKQYDFYAQLARIGNTLLEEELASKGIRAIVSYRAKKPDRLKGKLENRNREKKYKNVKEIFKDIVDLAGVRVALYFPSDRDLLNEIMNELFDVEKRKVFPESSHKPVYKKRFSGYWATHYRVQLKKSDNDFKLYKNTTFEIQVASVLMHAWAEVEHDLVYKPYSGKLTEEELSILDEINGLVITGEIALERLQKAITKRTKQTNKISDKYEMTNFIVNSLGKNYLEKLKLGDTNILNNYFNNVYEYDPTEFSMFLNNISQSVDESISEQLINMFITDYLSKNSDNKSLKEYFNRAIPNRDTSGFEAYVKSWIILEKTFLLLLEENGLKDRHRKYFVPDFRKLEGITSITKTEAKELRFFRQLRNELLHGIESSHYKDFDDNYLNSASNKLRGILLKIINDVNDETKRINLLNELENL